MHRATTAFPALVLALACAPQAEVGEGVSADLTGSWRAVLESPGGELPFGLDISASAGELVAVAVNGEERAPFSSVEVDGRNVRLAFDYYDSEITAVLEGQRLEGRWSKVVPEGASTLPFRAERVPAGRAAVRFQPRQGRVDRPTQSISGTWAVEFTDEDGTEIARGEFQEAEDGVTGTFLTPTGDYRFLVGDFDGELLRLSTFDGGHAFLFRAHLEDGELVGDFWSRDSYHATWRARPISEDQEVLPDAWALVGLTNEKGRFGFAFPDPDGQLVTSEDPRFADKVVLVNIFGSWCPNCNDKAPLLADWHRRYRDRGLEIVGLAYEFTGDFERDGRQVRRFAERHGIDFPLLVAGVSDKTKAAQTLTDLTAVIAYPTSVFIGRDGKVRSIHTGFSGPGTGEHFVALVAELEAELERLLEEPTTG